jgi:hypothetical protein
MTDDRGKSKKEKRLEKAKGRLQQSFPVIQQRVRASSAVDVAQSIFRQFADDIQLKDLLAKAQALVANADRAVTNPVSKDITPAQTFRDEASSSESSRKARVKKAPAKGARSKKAAPKKTVSKKKKKQAPKRKVKARA